MIHNNHDRFLEEKRKRAVQRRLLVCVFLLIILFSIIKVKKDRQEYAEEPNQAEIAHEKKASQQQTDSEEKPVEKEKTDEEVFEEIRKNENIFRILLRGMNCCIIWKFTRSTIRMQS